MRFWQKTFIVVLTVFIIAFNLCMVLVMHFSYNEELRNIKMRALGEVHFIVSSISNEISARSTLELSDWDETIEKVVANYIEYYAKQGIQLAFGIDDEVIASSFNKESEDFAIKMEVSYGKQKVAMERAKDYKKIIVATTFMEPNEEYKIYYGYAMDEVERARKDLLVMMISIDGVMSILIAIVLFVVLTYLTNPLMELSDMTEQMAQGNYSERVNIKGKDEVALLGHKFNRLGKIIEDQIEELKLENEKKQLLIDNMAHELRTPLTSISGYAEYMKVAPLNEDERIESLDYIMSETKRLEKLSKTVLQMADLRESQLEVGRISIDEMISQIEGLFHKQKLYKNVTLEMTSFIDFMEGNDMLIESLLINLIENGMRACLENGKVEVTFSKGMRENNEPQVEIVVKDNGIGMSEEELSKISEPFYRIDKARSRKAGGVGLGVSLCYQIVEAHKGKISYTSKVNQGTYVKVELPYIS